MNKCYWTYHLKKKNICKSNFEESELVDSLRSKRFRLVSEQRKTSVLAAREMKQEPKNESGGRGRGRKETLADKPLDFENLRSPANAAPDWLG